MTTTHPTTPPIALILGISGAIGRALAETLAARGFQIHALVRIVPADPDRYSFPVKWVQGDALKQDDVINAAKGASLIIHAVNPPGYRNWREAAIPMLANTIDAAKQSGATILFPANVYVFSPASGVLVSETSPMVPETRKGRVRLEMEAMLADAATKDQVHSIAVRAGDFFGPGVVGSWFTQALVKGGRSAKAIKDLSPPGVGHSWAYIPDLAETFCRLVDRKDTLDAYTMVHFGGHWVNPGSDMAKAVQRSLGRSDVKINRFPWFTVYLGAPFVPFLRELIEMLWLWRNPMQLDNSKLVSLIGPEPHTPLETAVSRSLDG